MGARLINVLNKLRSSMWVIPTVMATVAGALATVISLYQTRIHVPAATERFLFSGDAAGARAILTSIAGSMIGVTGVVFSITIVALTLASGQFGPRLLRNFMRDRLVQTVLGTFIATFVYCLLALRSVRDVEGAEGAYLSVVVAVLFAIASIGVLIYFIHHIASSIQADSVIANVGTELNAMIDRLYPQAMGKAAGLCAVRAGAAQVHEQDAAEIHSPRSGYLQAVDFDGLLRHATEHDLLIRLDRRPGRFVVEGHVAMTAWPADRVTEAVRARLQTTLIVGARRTAEQDIEFLVDQLVEIAVRSLSPGINDPFTAVSCVDRLGAALCALSRRQMPSREREDKEGRLRVIADTSTFEGIFDAAFHQIRQYSKTSVAVTIRLLETLEVLARHNAWDPARSRIIREHADRVLRTSALVTHEEGDALSIHGRYERVIAALPAP